MVMDQDFIRNGDEGQAVRLLALWAKALTGKRVELTLEDDTIKRGFVERVDSHSASIAWAHTPTDPEPGHGAVGLETLLMGDGGWRLVSPTDSAPRNFECIIKAPHDQHRYRPEGVEWPVPPYDANGWLECPGLVDLAVYDTFN